MGAGTSPFDGKCVQLASRRSPSPPQPIVACGAHPSCSGLQGDCCPTAEGLMLGCCGSPPVPPQPPPPDKYCGAHHACSGLRGDCCPTADGRMLDCCAGATP